MSTSVTTSPILIVNPLAIPRLISVFLAKMLTISKSVFPFKLISKVPLVIPSGSVPSNTIFFPSKFDVILNVTSTPPILDIKLVLPIKLTVLSNFKFKDKTSFARYDSLGLLIVTASIFDEGAPVVKSVFTKSRFISIKFIDVLPGPS